MSSKIYVADVTIDFETVITGRTPGRLPLMKPQVGTEFPFATIHIVFGTPFVVPKDAKDLEPYCEKLQSIMDEITIQGDELAGIKPDGKGPERVKGA